MKINENAKLVLRDVYLFDIESCHYSIMKHVGLDLTGINVEDKLERNTQIGKMMRKNPRLTSLLRKTTTSLIDEYIRVNNLGDNDILLRQYDGIVTKKILRVTDLRGIPFNIRKHFLIFISSIDRKKYIALDSQNEITIKGVSHRYEAMDEIYERICKLRFSNKESLFRNLQKIKDEVIFSDDAKLFGIPTPNGKYNIFLKEYGQVEISKGTLKVMDPDDIDKEIYFKNYIEPFTKSIVVEFVR